MAGRRRTYVSSPWFHLSSIECASTEKNKDLVPYHLCCCLRLVLNHLNLLPLSAPRMVPLTTLKNHRPAGKE